jgi:hypothetical protein
MDTLETYQPAAGGGNSGRETDAPARVFHVARLAADKTRGGGRGFVVHNDSG